MPDVKISALPAGVNADGTEPIPVVQEGVTVRVTLFQLLKPLLQAVGSTILGWSQRGSSTIRTVDEKLAEIATAADFGAVGDNFTDDLAACVDMFQKTGILRFKRINGAATTYYLSYFTGGPFDGATVYAEEGVTLSLQSNQPYSLYKNIKFATDVRVYFRDIKIGYTFKATPLSTHKESMALQAPALRRNRIAIDCSNTALVTPRNNAWPTDDTFLTTTAAITSRSLAFPSQGGSSYRGAFVEVGAYETVSAIFDAGIGPGAIGVIIRGTLGFSIVYSNGATGNYFLAFKPTGGALVGNTASLAWPELGQGSYTSFAPDKAVWSVSKLDKDRAVVKLNGKALTQPYPSATGDIVEVGFVCYTSSAFSISGITIERRTDAALGMQSLLELRIFGDSTAESFPSSWDQLLKPLLDGYYGMKLGTVTNYAVVGQTMEQQYTAMQTYGFGLAYYVVVCAGTNNVQGLEPIATWKTAVTDTINLILGQGRKPVMVVPWMWYTQAQTPTGLTGQAASAYDQGAPYRMWLERIAYELGVVLVKLPEELPNPEPSLLTSEPLAPLLRDNIHPDQLAHQLYALAICKAIVDDYMGMPDFVEEQLVGTLLLNGATAQSDLRLCYGKDGSASIAGSLGVTTIADGTAVLRMPRHVAPTHAINVVALALSSAGAVLGSCWINIDPSVAAATLHKVPATATVLILAGAQWKTSASST